MGEARRRKLAGTYPTYPDYAMQRYGLGEREVNGLPLTIGAIVDEGAFRRVVGGLHALDGRLCSVNVQTSQSRAELENLRQQTGGYASVTGRIDDQRWQVKGNLFQYIIGKVIPCLRIDGDLRHPAAREAR